MEKRKFEITGSFLKWTAILLMPLNHACTALQLYLGIDNYFVSEANWYLTRAAFIIFAFLISEGMHYTRDRYKYIFYLFLFAIISEVPYDLCLNKAVYKLSSQNVFFTLGLGALAITGIDHFKGKPFHQFLAVLVPTIASIYISSDYYILGVPVIASFYVFRDVKWKQLVFTSLVIMVFSCMFYWHAYAQYFMDYGLQYLFTDEMVWKSIFIEFHGLVAIPLIALYRGKKGRNINKWFFYLFYPGHLILIWCVVNIISLVH